MFRTKLVFPIDGRAATSTEIRGLQAGGNRVEVDEPGRHAGDQPLVLLQLLDGAEAALHQVAERDEAGANPVLGDGKDRALRFVEQEVRLQFGLVRLDEYLVGRVYEVAKRGFLFDDPRVVFDVRRSRDAVGERRNVGRTSDIVEIPGACQLLLQRHEVDRIAALAEHHHLVEDAAMSVAEEVARVDQLRGVVECVVVNQDGPENRFLSVEIVGKRTLGGDSFRHEGMKEL